MIKKASYLFILLMAIFSCQERNISFSTHIKPVLNARCVGCHGGVKKQGGLSLMTREEALSPSPKTGSPVIIEGSAQNSDLFQRIVSSDPDYSMPRGHEPLPPHEIKLLKDWINQGAKWEDHWAYLPIKTPSVPEKSDAWAETNIDAYIIKKLQEEGIAPNKNIDKTKLARRVSLDIEGLPPDPELASKYINGQIGYDVYLDSLVSSKSYGEHWASMWLDLARYADSKGYEKDPHRNIWRYREWVINALNNDMPFDEFTLDQIAGDIIAPDLPEKLIATAFHRNSLTNTEGGTDDEEFRVASVMDRLNTTFEIWQGTTMACAQCHDHPYDAISQKEFFESMSLFNNSMDADLAGEYPVLETFTTKTQEEIDELISYISTIENKNIQIELSTVEKIKKAIFPKLLPRDCDDFYNMLIFPDGIMSNWTNNVNDMKGRKFYFMYNDVDFENLSDIEATYATSGEKAEIKMTLDSLGGALLYHSGFKKTKSVSGHEWSGRHEWKKLQMEISQVVTGKHDVIFEIINPSLEVPEGIVLFKEFELKYEDGKFDENLDQKKNDLIALRTKAEKTPIIREKSPKLPRLNQIHIRGNQRTRGDTVFANVPYVFKWDKHDISNRKELAAWLVDESNPLTARVIVNRVWANIFGVGIVSTLEDFGTQGAPPTHPNLLDYLAHRFMHTHNWSLKELVKEILSSRAYRQSTETTKEKLAIDPYNEFVSRGPRMRLSAEQLRDQALAVSGLLYDSIGGPSVMPPQPEGVWQTVYNNSKWNTSQGKHKYRRGLYTYWKRSSPYPSMESFDSPSREVCKSQRILTNTPNQALVILNDPVYLEAANAIGVSMEKHSDIPAERVEYAYKKSFYEKPNDQTMNVLLSLYQKTEKELGIQNPTSNETLESPSAVVAHTILNLDAFLNKS